MVKAGHLVNKEEILSSEQLLCRTQNVSLWPDMDRLLTTVEIESKIATLLSDTQTGGRK